MRNLNVDARPTMTDTVRVPAPPPTSYASAMQQTASPPKIAVLGPTLRFKGELSAEEDFILQGRIEGSINHTQSVTIGVEGSVLGNIHARVITIDGVVEGDLHGADAVIVHETGKVIGNIFAPKVGLVEGAFFNGRIEMPARAGGIVRTSTTPPGVPLTPEETEQMLNRNG